MTFMRWRQFTNEAVNALVRETRPGVYLLARGRKHVDYVGWAGRDLKATLRQHLAKGYHVFSFEYALSPRAAFRKGCALYHHYRPIDNQGHPVPPERTGWQCPLTGCQYSH